MADAERSLRALGLFCLGAAVALAVVAASLRWEEKADFDLLGIAWFLGNMPGLLAAGGALVAAFSGVALLLRAAGHR